MQNKPEDLKTDGDCCCYNIIESSKKHLDIKVLDDPDKVYDVKQKVLELTKRVLQNIQQGEYEQVLRLYNESLEISREMRSAYDGVIFSNKGIIYHEKGEA